MPPSHKSAHYTDIVPLPPLFLGVRDAAFHNPVATRFAK